MHLCNCRFEGLFGLGAVVGVYFESDAVQFQFGAGYGSIADAHKGVEYQPGALDAVQLQTHLGDLYREGRRMRALFVAALNGFVRHEPGIATATAIRAVGAAPTVDIGLILVFDADRKAVEGDVAALGQMEDILVAIVDIAWAVDGFIMAHRDIAGDTGVVADVFLLDGDGFDPVNNVLQCKVLGRHGLTFCRDLSRHLHLLHQY